MSTYEQLKGLKVKYLSADTSGDRLQEGELFYNSSDFSLKSHIAVGAWSAGGSLGVARKQSGGAGTLTAGLAFGGSPPSGVAYTEEYNGVGWTAGGDLNTARNVLAGMGTQTAALGAGGYAGPPSSFKNSTEEYD